MVVTMLSSMDIYNIFNSMGRDCDYDCWLKQARVEKATTKKQKENTSPCVGNSFNTKSHVIIFCLQRKNNLSNLTIKLILCNNLQRHAAVVSNSKLLRPIKNYSPTNRTKHRTDIKWKCSLLISLEMKCILKLGLKNEMSVSRAWMKIKCLLWNVIKNMNIDWRN